MLRVSKIPPGDPTTEQYTDQNRFECLTCPYQYVIKKRFYERKNLTLKSVDDVIGGEGAWDGVEKAKGTLSSHFQSMGGWGAYGDGDYIRWMVC